MEYWCLSSKKDNMNQTMFSTLFKKPLFQLRFVIGVQQSPTLVRGPFPWRWCVRAFSFVFLLWVNIPLNINVCEITYLFQCGATHTCCMLLIVWVATCTSIVVCLTSVAWPIGTLRHVCLCHNWTIIKEQKIIYCMHVIKWIYVAYMFTFKQNIPGQTQLIQNLN